MEQTIIQIGNSYGIIIPKQILNSSGLKPGNKVIVQNDLNGKSIILSQNKNGLTSSITPDFLKILENINKKYGLAFKKLANR